MPPHPVNLGYRLAYLYHCCVIATIGIAVSSLTTIQQIHIVHSIVYRPQPLEAHYVNMPSQDISVDARIEAYTKVRRHNLTCTII